VAPTLQAALDDWARLEAPLRVLAARLESGEGQQFYPQECLSPLPRAFQWADGSAYVNHVELVRKARNAPMPASFWTDPLMYQGGSDTFLAPMEAIPLTDPSWGLDFEAEVAVVTDDVSSGATVAEAASRIRLIMLVNDVSLRNLIPDELAKGFGFFQSKPSSAFSPVAITPDELGVHWSGGRLHRTLAVDYNGKPFGRANAGIDMTFDFPTLVAHAAKTRALGAGTIIGSGTVSNRGVDGGPGRPVSEGGVGYSCIAEQRTIETLVQGAPRTPFMNSGDRIRIEMHGDDGRSIFGAIDQQVA
ncbi:MAG: fumarylacetoacetate hydrolase family protein, partial [Gammaproteobacteria bacterium]|nr:fumarylacetoacetate hydrolase family protein [Gammaproteobacteria bacterium]